MTKGWFRLWPCVLAPVGSVVLDKGRELRATPHGPASRMTEFVVKVWQRAQVMEKAKIWLPKVRDGYPSLENIRCEHLRHQRLLLAHSRKI